MRLLKIPLLVLTFAFTLTTVGYSDSLFPGSSTYIKSTGMTGSLFADTKAHGVGDTLSIIINETASASSTAATKNSKSENLNYGPGFGPILFNLKAFGATGSVGSNASGSTNRNDNLSAHIAVTVKEVLPNGNLVVEGKRQVGMNSEMQQITLTGVVRPSDIAADNTVQSPLVADARIKFDGKGPVGDKQHDGLIAKIFKILF
jgi:flagellar L-ring protein precursor FlgH